MEHALFRSAQGWRNRSRPLAHFIEAEWRFPSEACVATRDNSPLEQREPLHERSRAIESSPVAERTFRSTGEAKRHPPAGTLPDRPVGLLRLSHMDRPPGGDRGCRRRPRVGPDPGSDQVKYPTYQKQCPIKMYFHALEPCFGHQNSCCKEMMALGVHKRLCRK